MKEVKVLHLTIKRRWFLEILRGVKTLEYRANKPYWNRRLDGKHFDEVHFRNGYSHNAPLMRIQVLNIVKGVEGYIIELGEILEFLNPIIDKRRRREGDG